jgi:hypothetical protein
VKAILPERSNMISVSARETEQKNKNKKTIPMCFNELPYSILKHNVILFERWSKQAALLNYNLIINNFV